MTIDMTKQAAMVSLTKQLEKSAAAGNDPGDIEIDAEMYIDTSTSMSRRYDHKWRKPSEMQQTVTRNLALQLTGLDKDGNIPVSAFDAGVRKIGTATEGNYEELLDKWLKKNSLVPATNFMPIYADVMQDVPGPDDTPRVIYIHTDGVPSDKNQFLKAIVDAADKPIFWIFIGHGQSLEFLRHLDTMDGRVVDNVALIEVDDAADLSDEEYFDAINEELITSWFPAARAKKITNK